MARVVELVGGRYEVEELIGSGGMGEVYRARDVRLDRTVALKRPSQSYTGSSRERFRREAQSAARLNHPHVVTVYDWGDEDAEPYLVMEHVEGRSLRSLLQGNGPLAPTEVARIGAQIADALAHAHAKGVVHRDVKPSNVLLTTSGTVKVTDFGIAQSATGEALTEPGIVIGTAGYLSPEQAAGQRADARSDVYSLGVVLTELLTGSREPDAADDVGVGEPVALAELRRVIGRARAVERDERYVRATELREALRACARDTDGIPAVDPSREPATPRTGAVVDVPTATVAALTGTVADPTKVLAPPARVPEAAAVGADPADGPIVEPAAEPVAESAAGPAAESAAGPDAGGVVAAAASAPAGPDAPATVPVPTPSRRVRRARRRAARAERVAARRAATSPAPQPARSGVPATPATRRWRISHVAWLVAAPVALALAAAAVLAYRVLTTPPETTVPAVVGNNLFASQDLVEAAGLEWRLVEVESPAPAGRVLAVHPKPGDTLREGDVVSLRYSSDQALVPDVIGMNETDAAAALRGVGLVHVAPVDDYTDRVAPGTVTATEPLVLTEVGKGDTVTLSIARDPSVDVPRGVVGVDEATARAALELAGLVPSVRYENSRSVPAGQVIGIDPDEGEGARRGDTVAVLVSAGPKPVSVPYVVQESWDDAYDELRDEGFAVEVRSSPSPRRDVGRVIAQDPSGGQLPQGSTVTITVGAG